MGKEYFEFLEEEYQALTTQLQKVLGAASDGKTVEQHITRCSAVYQQMRAEAVCDKEYRDRLALYRIQLKALNDHYLSVKRQEIEISFDAPASCGSERLGC